MLNIIIMKGYHGWYYSIIIGDLHVGPWLQKIDNRLLFGIHSYEQSYRHCFCFVICGINLPSIYTLVLNHYQSLADLDKGLQHCVLSIGIYMNVHDFIHTMLVL